MMPGAVKIVGAAPDTINKDPPSAAATAMIQSAVPPVKSTNHLLAEPLAFDSWTKSPSAVEKHVTAGNESAIIAKPILPGL